MIDAKTRELFIYDDIGPSWAGMIGADAVKNWLAELGPGDINVRINSYGGSVDQALAMIEVLGRHDGQVSVSVDSIAASAASLFPVVFPSTAASHARIMIHDPWGVSIGNSSEMRKSADILDKYRDSILTIYSQGMSKKPDEISQMMSDETWFSAAEALDVGLVDQVTEMEKKVAPKSLAPDRFRNAPKDLMANKPALSPAAPLRVAAGLAILKRKIDAKRSI